MDFNTKNIQQQYHGFLNTQLLWEDSLNGLQQFIVPKHNTTSFSGTLTKSPRLGKRVESFVSCYLQQYQSVTMLAENCQIQDKKITIGELDCLLMHNQQAVHLEIIYKFYLYDNTVGTSEIDHWIGPNRNDSLQHKLEKLTTKQLPLLYKKECEPLLQQLNLKAVNIKQRVLFKAQLFVPYSNSNIRFKQLNKDAVSGFYINLEQLHNFTDCKFYIPSKMNWLLAPTPQVDWLNYTVFEKQASQILAQKTAPLCWMKQQNGELIKFFMVWWNAQRS